MGKREEMENMIFVCTGNTCRSPMAAALYNDMKKSCNAISRGIAVFKNTPASQYAVEAMKELKIDISNHVSTQIVPDDIAFANLLLVMGESHKRILINASPEHEGKIFTIYEYAKGIKRDVKDPFGGSMEEYTACRNELKELIEELIKNENK